MADIRFEIIINGKSVCVSGVEGFAVMSAGVTYVKRDPARYAEQKAQAPPYWSSTIEEWSRPSVGISGSALVNGVHSDSFDCELKPGDEVTIRILGPDVDAE